MNALLAHGEACFAHIDDPGTPRRPGEVPSRKRDGCRVPDEGFAVVEGTPHPGPLPGGARGIWGIARGLGMQHPHPPRATSTAEARHA
jgi:hypothetical protein